jgi:uncharacterized membrane protein YecN with MAPEG domain
MIYFEPFRIKKHVLTKNMTKKILPLGAPRRHRRLMFAVRRQYEVRQGGSFCFYVPLLFFLTPARESAGTVTWFCHVMKVKPTDCRRVHSLI